MEVAAVQVSRKTFPRVLRDAVGVLSLKANKECSICFPPKSKYDWNYQRIKRKSRVSKKDARAAFSLFI